MAASHGNASKMGMREFHGKNHRAAVSVPERASVSTPREPRSISNCTQFISTALEPDSPLVIAGLDPAIHHLNQKLFFLMDARVKPGHDGSRGCAVGNYRIRRLERAGRARPCRTGRTAGDAVALFALAAELLELGEHGVDVELVAGLLLLGLGLAADGGLRGRQQRRARRRRLGR